MILFLRILLIVVFLSWTSWIEAIFGADDENVLTVQSTRKLIAENLRAGDGEEKIIQFFETHRWTYSYDKYTHRYQTGPPDEEENSKPSDPVIAVWIYVDLSGSFQRAKVRKVYTFP